MARNRGGARQLAVLASTCVFRMVGISLGLSLLATVSYVASNWGHEHSEKIYWLSFIFAILSMILDSAELVALTSPPGRIPRQPAPCIACEDFALICMGTISTVIIIFSEWNRGEGGSSGPYGWATADLVAADFVTPILCFIRLVSSIWGCTHCCTKRDRPRPATVVASAPRQAPAPADVEAGTEMQDSRGEATDAEGAPPPYAIATK